MAPKIKRAASLSESGTTYQVFLSFRGPDTRLGFTDILYHALTDAGIRVFRDNEEIRKGEEIGHEILTAIDQSKVFVPIFSKGYASSKWCLIELAKMSESVRASSGEKKILPIFYYVSVDDVKLKTKLYAGALTMHRKTGKFSTDTVRQWKEAFHGAGKIKGYELKDQGYAEFAKSFVREVSSMLKVKHVLLTHNLVQRDDQVKDLMELLDIDSPGVRFVGIHGMGGVGKTTLAKVVFNELCDRFAQTCFLADVRESSQQKGIEKLQEQLLDSAGPKMGEIKLKEVGRKSIIRMPRKKLLLVLDDVGDHDQMHYLAGDASWFGCGTRVIITTRDRSILGDHVPTLEVEHMKHEEALRLFSKHAFDQDSPPSGYLSLSEEVVESTGGLPLALEVIGSHLQDKHERIDWENILRSLKKAPHDDVEKTLMISYEALKDGAKQIFLDIATFFIGHDKEYPMYVWEACGFNPEEGLEDLKKMSLVRVESEELRMHDQLRDMGRKIASKSRIWNEEDALKVVQRQEPNKDIEMLSLDLRRDDDSERRYMELSVSGLCFPNLRCLMCVGPGTLELKGPLPRLTCLYLSGCKLVGRDFGANSSSCWWNFAVFVCRDCSIPEDWEGWSQIGAATHLRVLDLSKTGVTRLPPNLPISLTDLLIGPCSIGKSKNLKVLHICNTGIEKLPTSIGMLKSLEELCASSCSSLEEVPSQIAGCTCLRVLNLSNSGLARLPPNLPISLTDLLLKQSKITELPYSIGESENLKVLDISGTGIEKLPISIGMLKSLEKLVASLEEIPQEIKGCTRLRVLDLSESGLARFPPNLPISLTNLLFKKSKITELPYSIGQSENLKVLDISGTGIEKLPASIGMLKSLEELVASGCSSLEEIPQEIERCARLRVLDLSESGLARLPPNLPIGLTYLLLHKSKITELPYSIDKSKNLKVLHICDTGIEKLPTSIGMLKSLEELSASNCSSLEEVPSQIVGCSCLRFLILFKSDLARLPPNLPISLTELLLKQSKITELPYSIGELENLKVLDISGTGIEKLPTSIGMLKSLEELVASGCSSLEEIPREIEECARLRVLDLSESGLARLPPNLPISLTDLLLKECKITELPYSIGKSENLKVLHICNTGIEKLPTSIRMLKSLEELSASNCSSLEEVPSQIVGCSCLRVLKLSNSGLARLPPNLPISLTELLLKQSKITELPYSIGESENLKVLDISGTGIEELPTSIGMLKSLEKLVASGCSSLEEIPQEIEECARLRVLDLSESGLARLPPNLPISLTDLLLNQSKITELPYSIGELENLKVLDISGTGIEKLPTSIGMLKSLEKLCAFGCSSLEEVSSQIVGCTCLRVLNLRGSGLARLPPNLPISLTDLIIGSSKFTELPYSIGKSKNLKVLHICDTGIEKLPTSIGMLKSLEVLCVSNCSSLKEVSSQIVGCTCLRVLNLSNSGLARLPPYLPINLTDLLLNQSKITELPYSVGELENLKVLDISGTGIEKLPTSIGMLKSLEVKRERG